MPVRPRDILVEFQFMLMFLQNTKLIISLTWSICSNFDNMYPIYNSMWKIIYFHLQISCCLFINWPADIDNNGFLDSNDFECMALRACIIEGKGDCNPAKLTEYQHIMRSLWDEISDLADFDKVWTHVGFSNSIWFDYEPCYFCLLTCHGC